MKLKITNNGFTLLELLVAISVFSFVSVMAYGGLQNVINSKQSSDNNAQRMRELQLAVLRISDDLRQSVARNIRDEFGDIKPAMQSELNANDMVSWTRSGYRNPAHQLRSRLQRVGYRLSDNKIYRVTWPVLDRAQDTTSQQSEVLSGVVSVEWRFMKDDKNWVTSWPDLDDGEANVPLPRAVEVTFELKDMGKLRRLILIGTES